MQIGFSLSQSLDFIIKTEPQLAAVSCQVINSIKMGNGFADSIISYISQELSNQIKIAESHGQLQITLAELAEFSSKKLEQNKKLKSLLVYPLILGVLLATLLILIEIFVLPQVSQLSGKSNSQHHLLKITGVLLLVIFSIWGMVKYLNSRLPSKRFGLLIKLPIIGKIFRYYVNYYLASNLMVLLKNGLSIKEIILLINHLPADSLIFELGQQVAQQLQVGASYRQITSHYEIIAPELIALIDGGKTVTEMAQSMMAYSKTMFSAMVQESNRLMSFVQPVIFLTIGIIITVTYLQILLPIYDSVRMVY